MRTFSKDWWRAQLGFGPAPPYAGLKFTPLTASEFAGLTTRPHETVPAALYSDATVAREWISQAEMRSRWEQGWPEAAVIECALVEDPPKDGWRQLSPVSIWRVYNTLGGLLAIVTPAGRSLRP